MESTPQPQTTNQLAAKKQGSETQRLNINAYVDKTDQLRVSVGLPDTGAAPPPRDIVCIVDISASMGSSAACQTDGHTEYEDLGYALMDLVKHAVKTVVSAMRPQDRVALVLFDDRIEVPYSFTKLDESARKEILGFCDGMRNRGSTNIYDALIKGMDMILERPQKDNEAAIMFFTDGQPNCGKYSAQKAIVENINKYKLEKKFNYPIHCYAFGQYTACTSDLLYQIASITDGMFGYIQDAKTLGTIFINGIAYALCTAASSYMMNVELDGKQLSTCAKYMLDNGICAMPGLRYGQTSDTMFDVKGLLKDDSQLKITISCAKNGRLQFPVVKDVPIERCQGNENLDHQLRMETIQLFAKILREFRGSTDVSGLQKETQDFVERLKKVEGDSEFVPALIDTVDRQIVTMLAKQKYVLKWGEHQLRHLIRSLEMQVVGNSREQCLKDFGGQMFADLADKADDIYNSMDPPTASLKHRVQSAAQIANAAQFAAKMNNFDDDDNDCGYYGGGCFAGAGTIKMADGSLKLVKDLVKGDKIATVNGQEATVNCVIRTETFNGMTDMCRLDGGLLITPGHPVKMNNEWVYPRDLTNRQIVNIDAFYNLVVDQGHVATVNGVELILLGHGYTNGILKHEYLGTQKVIDDLKKMPGYEQGLVQLKQGEKDQVRRAQKELVQLKNADLADVYA